MNCLQRRQRKHGLLLLVLCTGINSLGQAGSWESGCGCCACPCSWCLSPSPLEPPKKLPSHLPDPLRPPLLCSPHAWLDKPTSCMISFFPLPPLPVLNSSKPRSEAKHKLDEQSLPVLQPCPMSDQAEEGILQPLKGKKEENVVQGAETDTLSTLHSKPCVSEGWRCRVTAESTDSLQALVLWD